MARAGVTTERVVAEAEAVADEVGLDSLTLAQVAQRLGVKLPSLYKHIDGLESLRRLLSVRCTQEMAGVFARAAAGRAGADALVAIANACRAWAGEHPGRYAATVRAPAEGDDEHLRAAADVLDVVDSALSAYALSAEDGIHATRTFRAVMHGFISLEQAGGFGLPVDVDRSFEIAVTGLAAQLADW